MDSKMATVFDQEIDLTQEPAPEYSTSNQFPLNDNDDEGKQHPVNFCQVFIKEEVYGAYRLSLCSATERHSSRAIDDRPGSKSSSTGEHEKI
ncbi:uncharacterized protein LOC111044868 isoform X3 [Nilaparvata lugens]|uniref:uncharacterized protein LOC111044868 isoform X3 n=1 Tax=Nilaparvata lugens TaxID=108931 RepID=UPI00193E53D9|nr:uncharacterized protein LOC111044868 isoform X3 [Nilaparvata lugens]